MTLNRVKTLGFEAALSEPEWIHLSEEQLTADPALREAVGRFRAPRTPAGDAATEWLQNKALEEMGHVATYVALAGGKVEAFYSLAMGEVELSSTHRKGVGASHPRAGAVLIAWLARAEAGGGAKTTKELQHQRQMA